MGFFLNFSFGPERKGMHWPSLYVAMLGIAISAAAAFSYYQTSQFLERSIKSTGTVIDLGMRKHLSYPVVSYADSSSIAHVLHSTMGCSPPTFELDEKVTVAYQPDNPGDAKIVAFFQLWFYTFLLGIFASSCLIASTFMYLLRNLVVTLA